LLPETDDTKTAACPQEFSIVGIGASAGGLEACSALLKALPADTGFAFVVIQHLDPTHESLLPALLSRATKIPVKHVKNEMLVEPNIVYVMPPNVEMLYADGMLRLKPREQPVDGVRLPIDAFFRSLAESCHHRAIGVILSGTGSDGALGLEMIKEEGGFTFAQDTQSAKFEGMPHSAFATGSVDFVLPPDGIGQELIRISKYPYAKRVEEVAKDGDAAPVRDPLRSVLGLLHKASGVDFSQYRSSTIQRRVFRRMAIHKIVDMEKYRRLLEDSPGEVEILCEEMIPRVTRFFRDPDVFMALKALVFPTIPAGRPGGGSSFRVWVPGCSSGEEVYAIAISLLEYCEEHKVVFPIQIFGTDLSAIAIQKARQGSYPDRISEDVSAERLQRFFVKRDGGYHISAHVREMCVFASHDLTSDPPYSKLDLISCRNVLIYLDSVQTRIIPMFHYALKPTGFLLLGAMETARRFADLFAPVDKSSQIYSKKPATQRQLSSWGSIKTTAPTKTRETSEIWDDADLQKKADRAVLAKYAPGGVVVNENWQVLQVRGKVSPYLEPAPGKMSANILAMAKRSGLAQDLAALLDQAKKEGGPVRRESIVLPHEEILLNLQVIPIRTEGDSSAYLVLFEEGRVKQFATDSVFHAESPLAANEYLRIQDELIATRERLATMLDTYQQYTEDTQSAQEESLSNLEEVQSFNEELETAKEELQSTNEELSTVNEELQTRNTDLQQARDFTTSIVETVQQPLMVLDELMTVKMANRAFYNTFQLSRPETEGRVLYDLNQGAWDQPALRQVLEKVLPEGHPIEGFELTHDFPGVGRKVLLISARRLNTVDMILVSMEDATARRAAEMELRRVQDELRHGQKMEAIGRLAGGVAHDFNNLLTGILGFSELLQDTVGEDTEAFAQAGEIKKAGERAAALTQQLLAFSRRQVLRPQSLDLNVVIEDSDRMLRRLIGEDIGLVTEMGAGLWPIYADPGQMSQVIINLALNARDAMPHGGVLTIRTENNLVEDVEDRLRGLKPGGYVSLTVSDTGSGMDAETQLHIFEPFFTTKPQGSGTGLGLATVLGIVEQTGGSIRFGSQLGAGSTFWIDLPRAEILQVLSRPGERTHPEGGTETILVVEDEEMVRQVAVITLKRLGYTVLEAADGAEGLAQCRSHPNAIDLMLTDIVMPGGLNGRQLAEQASEICPKLKVILTSGHTTDALVHYGVKLGAPFLQKPFTIHQLAAKVREVLDAGATENGTSAG
jgi:two-component system CheB/CheR fusion protein